LHVHDLDLVGFPYFLEFTIRIVIDLILLSLQESFLFCQVGWFHAKSFGSFFDVHISVHCSGSNLGHAGEEIPKDS